MDVAHLSRNLKKWSAYVKGSANRQEFLERALDWVSKGDIGAYMSAHRNDNTINPARRFPYGAPG